MEINGRKIGKGEPVYIIAEMSANHGGNIEKALEIVREAKKAGADCVKIQTYTADTITLNCDNDDFLIKNGLWKGYKLYDLYTEAYTPWEWQKTIKEECDRIGIDFFSTPFDRTAVDFLEEIGVTFYKIASYEFNDIDLIEYTASKGKPMIMSCGMATKEEIKEAIEACHRMNNYDIAILKCTSEYPAVKEDMNISLIPVIANDFNVVTGLSDHSFGSQVAELSVALGACVIEKHVIMHRSEGGPDAAFSMEMHEFADMVSTIRETEKIIGKGEYVLPQKELESRKKRRSLYACSNIKKGEEISRNNVKSVRPANGLPTKHFKDILGKKASRDISFGEAISWDMIN